MNSAKPDALFQRVADETTFRILHVALCRYGASFTTPCLAFALHGRPPRRRNRHAALEPTGHANVQTQDEEI